MRSFFPLFFKALPFSIGVILVLTALTLLVEFADKDIDLGNLLDREFWGFVILAVIGIPWLLLGINRLSEPRRRSRER